MKPAFVARGVHLPARFNASTETRARMFRTQRAWLAIRRIPAILAGDLNAKKPWRTGKRIQLLASHSVDNIYGSGGWRVINAVTVELRTKRLSDHNAVKVWLEHPNGERLTVATVNLKRHWNNPGTRALKIMQLLDADVVICNEANQRQTEALQRTSGLRVYQGRSNAFRGGWVGNLIVWRTDRVMATRRRNKATAYIYLRGKKRRRRPRVPVPAVNFSPAVWFAFVPKSNANR